ncbi:hypothetical protein AB0E27_31575 [Streptomyces sparsogenes]|uniref:DUF7439 family protein n=1 Tax=Streptomyces sparsogenes TaxID=67365 RepID=UPI0033D52EE2
MSKHRKLSAKGLGLIARALPTKYRSKAGLIAAILGVILSAAAVVGTDYPQVALVIQALTALGFVESSDAG